LDAGDKHIDPHVELEAPHQHGVADVFLDDHVPLLLELAGVVGEIDALALAAILGLDDVDLALDVLLR